MSATAIPADVDALTRALGDAGYLADDPLATVLYLGLALPLPVLLEGEPGVGKTAAATALAAALDTPLIRLQCYEGIHASEALYEWNFPRQLLAIRAAEARGAPLADDALYDQTYLLRRPILAALQHPGPRPAVLLIDEIDRADDDFEAFLLEILADAAMTIPELGTIRATVPPAVILTSNRTRELHDALKRRCAYHWIDHPTREREIEIVRRHVPAASTTLVEDVTTAVARLRAADVGKPPGVAEAIDWTTALQVLGCDALTTDAVDRTLGVVLKDHDDEIAVRAAGLAALAGGASAS